MGPVKYLVFYLLGGLIAMRAQVAINPSSTVPNLGASGAIAAVMSVSGDVPRGSDQVDPRVIFIFVRITFIPATLLIGVWFLTQLISVGHVATTTQSGGVAYVAHIAGIIYGMLTARLWEGRSRETMLDH